MSVIVDVVVPASPPHVDVIVPAGGPWSAGTTVPAAVVEVSLIGPPGPPGTSVLPSLIDLGGPNNTTGA